MMLEVILTTWKMSAARLWCVLLCAHGYWTFILAINCDWTKEYDHDEKTCCKTCPTGQYPKTHCKANHGESECEKCPSDEQDEKMSKCFCSNRVCINEECSNCVSPPSCKPGHQLVRTGAFDYTYICQACSANTYSDVENSICRNITGCSGLDMIFPGNSSHNSICKSKDHVQQKTTEPSEQENLMAPSLIIACFTVTVLICLIFIINTIYQVVKCRTSKKLKKHRMVLPTETCDINLSKEEKGNNEDCLFPVFGEVVKLDFV